jgi:outer membrane protein TolC
MASLTQLVRVCPFSPLQESLQLRKVFASLALICILAFASGCANRTTTLPPDVSAAAILERMTITPDTARTLEGTASHPIASAVGSLEPKEDSAEIPLFSLASACAYALENSPRIRLARTTLARAEAQEVMDFAPFLPEIGLLTRYGASSPNLSPGAPGPVGGILPSEDRVHSFLQAELDLQWTLWDFGRTSGRVRQAEARQRIAGLQLSRAQQTVAFDAATAYIGVLLAQATRLVQEQAIRRAEAVLQDARTRREGGVAERDDVLRAEVQLSEARDSLVTAREAEFNALARLNYAMGRNASLPVRVVDWKGQPRFDRTLVSCLEIAAGQRPEVRAATDSVAAAQHGLRAAEAEFMPRIYALSSVGHVDGDGIRTGWQEGAGIHVNQMLFAGGRRQGEAAAAEAEVRAAAASAQAAFDMITLEVNLAYRGQLAAHERIALTEPAVDQALENLRIVRVKYKNGNATPTDLVDAETAATRTQQRYYAAVYDNLASLARLEYALGTPPGSLWEQCQEPSEPEPELIPAPRPVEEGKN